MEGRPCKAAGPAGIVKGRVPGSGEAGHGPPEFGAGLDEAGDERMRPGRREPRSFVLIASSSVLGLAATLSLGACGLETLVGLEEASEAPQAAMDAKEKAEAPTAAADAAPEGSSRAILACRIPSLRMSADGENGAIVIVTKQSDGRGNGGVTPGRPPG